MMRVKNIILSLVVAVVAIAVSSCSTTKRLAPDELL